MPTTLTAAPVKQESVDFLPILGTDYVELYVGNAKQAAHFYKPLSAFNRWPMPDWKPACAIALLMYCNKEKYA